MSCCHHGAVQVIRASQAPPAALHAVAEQLVAVFGHAYPEWTVDAARDELANDVGLPISVIAMEQGRAIGCGSLLADDEVDAWKDFGPWLGNLWVDPAHRGRGVGRILVDTLTDLAQHAGAVRLHLVTDNAADWYARMGWESLGDASVHGHTMTVMRRSWPARSGLR